MKRFSILLLSAVSLFLVGCPAGCFFGPFGKPLPTGQSNPVSLGVSIGIDVTSFACHPYGTSPWFVTNYTQNTVAVTYQEHLVQNGTAVNPQPKPMTLTALASKANQFLGCAHSSDAALGITQDLYFTLLKWSVVNDSAASRISSPFIQAGYQKDKSKGAAASDPPLLDIDSCKKLCAQASGKCRALDGDRLITHDQIQGLGMLYDRVTQPSTTDISQKALLALFSMASDPCSRSTTTFTGSKSGTFTNSGAECTLNLSGTTSGPTSDQTVLDIPETLTGTFDRSAGGILLTFDDPLHEASVQTRNADGSGFSRVNLLQASGTPGRIVATAGDKCVEFKYSH